MEAPDQMPAINHSQQSLYSGNSCIQTRWICYRKSSTLMIPIKMPIIQSSIQIDSSRLGLRSLSEVTRFISTKLFFWQFAKNRIPQRISYFHEWALKGVLLHIESFWSERRGSRQTERWKETHSSRHLRIIFYNWNTHYRLRFCDEKPREKQYSRYLLSLSCIIHAEYS